MWLSLKLALLCVAVVSVAMAETKDDAGAAEEILALEKAAMERWVTGDVEGYLKISSDNVTYFDPFTAGRLNGLPELSKLYRGFAGGFHFDRFEFVDPKVQVSDNMAVLTYNLVTYAGAKTERWNATMVYQKEKGSWKIIHTHMSITQPKLAERAE